jgi:mono/diheme cytochrome c family protein
MKRAVLGLLGVVAALATVAAIRFGGWAVVSVESVPDYLLVGTSTELTFTVRQHGMNRLDDLSPTIVAKSGSREVTARATRLPNARYRADLVVPTAGDWRVVINTGFGRSRGNLLPIKALATAPASAVVVADADRGRMLFAAKGCITCHVHDGVDARGEASDAGPDLTNKRFAASYLAQYLADPSIKPANTPNGPRMPNPELKPGDISLLVAFINSERKTVLK